MHAQETFESLRPFLEQLAYRMLGSVQDAEDVAQDAWLRWKQAGEPALDEPRAWFTRTCTRLCLDRLRATQRAREDYFGEWLPEPWIEARPDREERDDTLSMALMHTVQKLSPTERAVFLLHDVFDYAFDEVGAMLELQPAHCRQLAVRARQHLGGPPRRASAAADAERLGASFFTALNDGDLDGLKRLLHEDVVLRSDGGGKVPSVHYPLQGRERVARFFDRIHAAFGAQQPTSLERVWFNGGPGFVLRISGEVAAAYQFDVAGGEITSIHVQRNPDKLRVFVAK